MTAALPSRASGGIRFQPPVNYPVPVTLQNSSSDLDGDGKLDILGFGNKNAAILYGRGDGTFEPAQAIQMSATSPGGWGSVHGIDVTGDGLRDLVAACGFDNYVAVRRNLGNRTFADTVTYPAGALTVDVTAADFDGDGHTDLASSDHDARSMSIFLNRGDGTFAPSVSYPSNGKPGRITGADYNRDGHADVAITNYISDKVTVYLGDGQGEFVHAGDLQAGSYPASVVSGDFNQDGNPDLATANAFGESVTILYGTGTGAFSGGVNFPTPVYPHLMSATDLDLDGDLDLAIPTYGSSLLAILENDGAGRFLPPVTFPSGGENTRALSTGDYNRDGRPDVAISNENTANISVFLNTTNVAPQEPPAAPSDLTATAISSSQINLAWNDNSNSETGFLLERRTDATPFALFATTAANVTQFQNSQLAPHTRYRYRVRAVNAGGVSAYSNVALAVTFPPIPSIPTGFRATVLSARSIQLDWTDTSSNETGFQLERRELTTEFALIRTMAANTETFSNLGLQPGTVYFYRLRAVNRGSASPYTSVVRGETPPLPPLAPSGLTAVVETRTLRLSWRDNSTNETGFQVERRLRMGTYTVLASPGANVTTVTDQTVAISAPYTYRVRAVNRGGNSAYSNEVRITLLPSLATLTAKPTAVRGGKKATGTVTLTGLAAEGGAVVQLTRSSGPVRLPDTVTVPAGATSATFRITTRKTRKTKTVLLVGTYNASTATATLKVKR